MNVKGLIRDYLLLAFAIAIIMIIAYFVDTKVFLSFLFAFIVKDFYDMFIQNKIKKYFSTYKILITKINGKENKEHE